MYQPSNFTNYCHSLSVLSLVILSTISYSLFYVNLMFYYTFYNYSCMLCFIACSSLINFQHHFTCRDTVSTFHNLNLVTSSPVVCGESELYHLPVTNENECIPPFCDFLYDRLDGLRDPPRSRIFSNLIQIQIQPTPNPITSSTLSPLAAPFVPKINVPTATAKCFEIFYQNVKGLRSKLRITRQNLALDDFDIFAFSESNLSDSFYTSEIGLTNYSVYRTDRDLTRTHKKSGGGVLLAVSNRFSSSLISGTSAGFDHLFVRVSCSNRNSKQYVFGVVYIPPSSPDHFYTSHFNEVERLQNIYSEDDFVLLGDYNLPELSWSSDGTLPNSSSPRSCVFLDSLSLLGLSQINFVRNNLDRTLDLVLLSSSDGCSVSQTVSHLPVDPPHPPLLVNLPISDVACPEIDYFSGFNFRKAPYLFINRLFFDFDWPSFLSSPNVDTNVELFSKFISDVIKVFVPSIHLKRDSHPVWSSSYLKSLIYQKKCAHKIFKNSKLTFHYVEFSRLRALCKRESHRCYSSYISSVVRNIKSDPRYFWKYTKTLRGSSVLPKVFKYGDIESSSVSSSADLFAKHFSTAFSDIPLCSPLLNVSSTDNVSSLSISISDVSKKLKGLSIHKGGGPDRIPPIFLKNCYSSLSFPLSMLFNQSLQQGNVPSFWKVSYVTPVPKKGPKNDVTNYRPITILSAIPKLFESIVLDKLLPLFSSLIIPQQHGFLPRKSVTSNLLQYLNYISDNIQGSQVDSIYIDLSKAFDSVNHRILLDKMSAFGVSGPLLLWFSSYLSNRHCVVRLGSSSFSQSFVASSGVPQGSHLGPILFLLFINDVIGCLSKHDVKFLLFCDDIKIFRSIHSMDDCRSLLEALVDLNRWFDHNLLKMNPSKCNIISFTRSKQPIIFDYTLDFISIPRSTCVRDLGVLMDSQLSFIPQIDQICSKASRMLGFIIRSSKDFSDCLSFKVLYCSLVRSILEFSSPIWNPSYACHVGRIERIQHKALKVLSFKSKTPFADYKTVQSNFNLLPLSVRREMFDVIALVNIISGGMDSPDLLSSINFHVPRYSCLRSFLPFKPPFVNCNYLQNSPLIRLQRIGNSHKDNFDYSTATAPIIKGHFARLLQE